MVVSRNNYKKLYEDSLQLLNKQNNMISLFDTLVDIVTDDPFISGEKIFWQIMPDVIEVCNINHFFFFAPGEAKNKYRLCTELGGGIEILVGDDPKKAFRELCKRMHGVENIYIKAIHSCNEISYLVCFNEGDGLKVPKTFTYVESMVISTVAKFIELIEKNNKDSLTCLLKRDCIESMLNYWLNQDNGQLAVIMADIDFFKKVNDKHGHGGGDCCLINVSQMIKGHLVNSGGVVARWGGEEFLIALPDTTFEKSVQIAEQIRKDIEETDIPYDEKGSVLNVTLSLGVVFIDSGQVPEQSPLFLDTLIKLADDKLYEAKGEDEDGGRNRVCAVDLSTNASV